MRPDLSVVICTHDRYEMLDQAVHTLLDSPGFSATRAELFIVDNTPVPLRQPIRLDAGKQLRIGVCEREGLSHARNYGIEHTKAPIVAFLDDDALVCPQWCSEVLQAFESDKKALAAGGKVVPHFAGGTLPAWYDPVLASHLSCIDLGPRPRRLKAGEWVVGANMAFMRSVFERFGLFDTSLGRKGVGTLLSNEESALLQRIGLTRVLYSPDMLVEHVISPKRLSARWFRRRAYWQAVSDMISGIDPLDAREARAEYGSLIAQLEADRRNLNALTFEPSSYGEFKLQLRAVYLAAHVLSHGGVDL